MRNPSSHFAVAPLASLGDMSRSTFDRNHDHKFTMSAGLLYPMFVDEYLPGDTFSLDTSVLTRMSTPIHPVMDNCYLDIYYFAVPYRLVWEHWKEFMGESPEDPYMESTTYSIPQLNNYDRGSYQYIPFKSVADYMGIPAGTHPLSFSALPFRAFGLIWNEYFRDQNLQNAINVDISDANAKYVTASNTSMGQADAYIFETTRGGALPPVNKFHDYFTSALISPQKGEPTAIPINGFAPVYAMETASGTSLGMIETGAYVNPVHFISEFGDVQEEFESQTLLGYNLTGPDGDVPRISLHRDANSDHEIFNAGQFSNLFADLSYVGQQADYNGVRLSAYATINDLRYAFQIQKLLEADNRYGTRYTEIIKGHFGVTAPDGLLQRPEFLGGKRVRVNMNQVLQTSSTDDVSPQGNTAAYSLTSDMASSFTKSFTEHGVIIGVCCIRNENTYQQGLERFWSRRDRYDFYFPELANISEQPIYNKEIFNLPWIGDNGDQWLDMEYERSNGIFGFQEAWAEYRYKPSRVSGEFRSTYPQSLDVWHYGDYYESPPYLSDEWIRADRANIDRTLAVSSDVSDQFICDFYFKLRCTRPMPVYSIPGLSDHH